MLRDAGRCLGRGFFIIQAAGAPACLVLDVRLPGLSGLELQRELPDVEIPIIFIAGHGDIPMVRMAERLGIPSSKD